MDAAQNLIHFLLQEHHMNKNIACAFLSLTIFTLHAEESKSTVQERAPIFGTPINEIPLSHRLKPAILAGLSGFLISQGARTIIIANPVSAYLGAAACIYALVRPEHTKQLFAHAGGIAFNGAKHIAYNAPSYFDYGVQKASEIKHAIEQKHNLSNFDSLQAAHLRIRGLQYDNETVETK